MAEMTLYLKEWTSWLQKLCLLEDFNIMRYLKLLDFREVTKAQLQYIISVMQVDWLWSSVAPRREMEPQSPA